MQIKSVQLRNFKRFGSLGVDLRSLNCLVGPNNSGKTTLLQALALFDFCRQHCLSGRNGSLELKARSVAPEELHVLPVANPRDLWTDRKTMAGRQQRVIEVRLSFDSGLMATAAVRLSYNRFGLTLETSDASQAALRALHGFSIAYLPVFSSFLPQEERRTAVAISDELARGRVHAVIRNLLVNLVQTRRHERLVEILRRLFPELERLDIGFDEASDRYITVEYREGGRAKALDVFSAGSGFQQLLYLFGFLLLREPRIVLLDEPDVHLHGHLQRGLLEELERLVAEGAQALFATHSRDLIERTDPQAILYLDGGQAKPLDIAFDVFDTLDALGSLDTTRLPVLKRYRRLLVVENKTDLDLLSSFCQHCLGVATWRAIERRIAVCYAGGNPTRQDIPRLRKQLAQAVRITGSGLELFVVADRDYEPEREELLASLATKHKHVEWHVWERAEIENYLLVPEAILRLLGESVSATTAAQMAAELERLMETSRERACDLLLRAYDVFSRSQKKGWDVVTLAEKSRAYLEQHWPTERVGLVDAKQVVLPALKRWCQAEGLEAFSDRRLAQALQPSELPDEVHEVARRLAHFAGVGSAVTVSS